MKETVKQNQLRLWKIRQEEEGHDVSGVNTLEDAEHFFDKEEKPIIEDKPKPTIKPKGAKKK